MIASVLLAHPRPGSLNHALAERAVRSLANAGAEVRFHDLYAEGFDPRLQATELETTFFADPLAARHAAEILEADRIVVVHPSWFFHAPAILKGWVDRVLREDVVFRLGAEGVEGLLRAERAVVVTTANAARRYEAEVLGDPLTTFWRDCAFGPAGVARVDRLVLGPVRGSSVGERTAWLEQVARAVTEEGSAP